MSDVDLRLFICAAIVGWLGLSLIATAFAFDAYDAVEKEGRDNFDKRWKTITGEDTKDDK